MEKQIRILFLDNKIVCTGLLTSKKFFDHIAELGFGVELLFEEDLVPDFQHSCEFPNSSEYSRHVGDSAREAHIVVVGNNLLAGIKKLELLGKGVEEKTIVTWNGFVPSSERLKYSKKGCSMFCLREEMATKILELAANSN